MSSTCVKIDEHQVSVIIKTILIRQRCPKINTINFGNSRNLSMLFIIVIYATLEDIFDIIL